MLKGGAGRPQTSTYKGTNALSTVLSGLLDFLLCHEIQLNTKLMQLYLCVNKFVWHCDIAELNVREVSCSGNTVL